MEYMYEGLVRYGFGFFNPNHAAGFICALLPFVWLLIFSRANVQKIVGVLVSILLLIALAFTYSRAGMLVLFIEISLFALFLARKHWKIFLSLGLVFIISLVFSSALTRISIDNSITNRVDILLNGMSLFAQNPFGVGLGNSGKIVSATMLENIDCRTLINSHLTLLVEFGIIAGFAWICLIFYALIVNLKHLDSKLVFASLVSFIGLLLSANISTIFDWQVLLNPSQFEYLSAQNLIMSYLVFILFIAIFLYLLCRKFSLRALYLSILLSVIALGIIFIASYKKAPCVQNISSNTFISKDDKPSSIVLFDEDYSFKEVVKILKSQGIYSTSLISLNHTKESLPKTNIKSYILLGQCCDFVEDDNNEYILISPNPYFEAQTKNIKKIYLPKWDSKYKRIKTYANSKKIEIIYY